VRKRISHTEAQGAQRKDPYSKSKKKKNPSVSSVALVSEGSGREEKNISHRGAENAEKGRSVSKEK
jgi:hypothetical protein